MMNDSPGDGEHTTVRKVLLEESKLCFLSPLTGLRILLTLIPTTCVMGYILSPLMGLLHLTAHALRPAPLAPADDEDEESQAAEQARSRQRSTP